jgi:hypothetical protein
MTNKRRDFLTSELFKIKLEEWFLQIKEKGDKKINKNVELNRCFVLYNGFQKTLTNKMTNLTVNDLNEIRQMYFYKIPNPRPIGIADDMPTPDMNEHLSFYLDKCLVDERDKKIIIDMFYKQDF